MSLPVSTTTISILRSDQDGTADDYDGVSRSVYRSVYRSGIRAVIGSPGGGESVQGGSSEDVTARLNCDVVDLRHDDQVRDEQTGETWEVTWSRLRVGLGLDHMVAGLRAVTDRVSA